MGAGHDGVARELERRLTRDGFRAEVVDFLSAFPFGLGWLMRRVYQLQLRYVPWTYELTYRMWMNAPPLVEVVTWPMSVLTRRRLLRWVRDRGAGLVVVTYPVAPLVLGRARQRGRLPVPLVTIATDFGVHELWTHPGVDLTLCVSEASARMAPRAGRTMTLGPTVPDQFFRLPDIATARAHFDLPLNEPLALVVAGAWGAGEVERAVDDLVSVGRAVPVIACGRNRALYDRLNGKPGVHVFGWTDHMATLLAACDVVVENAGGLSCMEAFAAARPVVTYRPIPGHGRHNATAMLESGVIQLAQTRAELDTALARALGEPGREIATRAGKLFRGDAAEVIAALLAERDSAPHAA